MYFLYFFNILILFFLFFEFIFIFFFNNFNYYFSEKNIINIRGALIHVFLYVNLFSIQLTKIINLLLFRDLFGFKEKLIFLSLKLIIMSIKQ